MTPSSKTQNWTGKAGFVISSVGAAVGLGAIWKFPYMAGADGGATFLIPFVIFSFTLAFGLLLAEITLGKVGKGGIVTAYKKLAVPFGEFWVISESSLVLSFYRSIP